MMNLTTLDLTPENLAKQWLESNCLILDTETTGLGDDAEICEISVINSTGTVFLNTLVKPVNPIPADATAIHGITNEMVINAPTWLNILPHVLTTLFESNVVIYNSFYDLRLMIQSSIASGVARKDAISDFHKIKQRTYCAMLAYAEYYGEINHYGDYRWQKLTKAADQQGVAVDGNAHRALADCKMTLGILEVMARSA
ncbi:3'-5' exonuclease [Photobacterium sp. DNB23_23_1]